MSTFYFAWVAEGEAFDGGVHNREDEQVFAFEIEHNEGDFPTLRIDVVNPRIGLLAAGRNLWCWLSWDGGSPAVEPLFTGRLIGVPENLTDEIVRLQFVARPPDFIDQKAALADALRVLPYWDDVWVQDRVDDPDAVLDTYTVRWHIGRLDLAVTTSDINQGEDGTIEIGEADHLYDDVEVSYGDAPLRRIAITGKIAWTQTGSGDVDITREMVAEFQAAGSSFSSPIIGSFTGDGLISSWPTALSDIGGGWAFGSDWSISAAPWFEPVAYVITWVDHGDDTTTPYQNPALIDPAEYALSGWKLWQAGFPLNTYQISAVVHWDAARSREEIVTASVEADVQSLIVDPGAAEEETISLNSSYAGEPVEGGSPETIPIGDLRRNSYFKTDRGAQSFEYLLLLARAKLLTRARAVQIKFVTPFSAVSSISCRHNVRLLDYRLPAGEATGKVISYVLSASGEGEFKAEVTIGCSIGYGAALAAAASGTPVYVDDGYVDDGYQVRSGATEELIVGELQYQSFDDFEVTDDDGVDLFNMVPSTVLNSITVDGGPSEQRIAIDTSTSLPVPDPIGALRDTPTIVTLDLKPTVGGPFSVTYAPNVSMLVVPQTVNLEAPAGSP